MKKSIITTVIVAFVSIMGVNAQDKDKFEIQVDGLGCPFCAYGLEKKFKEFKGIDNVEIEIETGNFTFDYPSEKNLSMADVEGQVEKAGYTPITTKIVRADGTVEESQESEMIASDVALTEESLYVYGKCGMCEARIVKAAKKVSGVADAQWDQKTGMLEVSYDAETAELSDIEGAVVKVGHDTKDMKADKKVYEDLPACCHYKRENQ